MQVKKNDPPKVTIEDVARVAGVSKTTISRYLNKQYDSIAPKTKKKIEETISLLNYRPNLLARGLKSDRSNVIAMILADIRNPYSTAILRGAEDLCKKHDYSLMICNSDNDPVKERDYFSMLYERRIDGLIINSTGQNHETLQRLADDDIPVVLVDREVEGLQVDMVATDNYTAMAEAMKQFLGMGYESFAFFSEFAGISSRKNRISAYREVLVERGHPSFNEIYEVDLTKESEFVSTFRTVLDRSKGKRRLILAANGLVTLKLIHAVQAEGLSIPGDIAVAGFDELEWSPIVGPGITTIAQETYQIGLSAMECLLGRINGDASPAKRIRYPGKLIMRGSTP